MPASFGVVRQDRDDGACSLDFDIVRVTRDRVLNRRGFLGSRLTSDERQDGAARCCRR